MRGWRAALPVLVFAALIPRVGLALATRHYAPWGDPAAYHLDAAWIALGHGMFPTTLATPGTPSAFRPPAYPSLLGAVYAVAGIHLTAGRLLSVALGVLTVVLIAYLGRELWSPRVGLVAGAIGALFLPLIDLNASLLSEALFVPLGLALAISLLRVRTTRHLTRWAAVAGVLCGLGALTRTVGVVWLIPALAVIIATRAPRANRLVPAAVAVAAFLAVLAPWTIRNAEAFHAFVPISTQNGFTLAGQYNEEAGRSGPFDAVSRIPPQVASLRAALARLSHRTHGRFNESQVDRALLDAGLGYMRRHPGHVVVAIWLDSLRLFNLGINHRFTTGIAYREMGVPHSLWLATTLSIQLIAVLVALAVLLRATGRSRVALGPWWLWAIGLLPVLAAIPFGGTPRYLIPAFPLLVLVAAAVVGSGSMSASRTRLAPQCA